MAEQKNPRIAVLLYGSYSPDARVRRQSETLVEMGFDVDVIALREASGPRTYALNGVKVHQLPMMRKRGGVRCYCLQYLLFLLLGSVALTVMFASRRYKVVHVNNMPDFIVFCALIPKLFGAKVILDIHDPFPELFSLKLSGKWGRRFYPLLLAEERISTAFVDHVITTTDLIAATLQQRGVPPEKITVVMNTPDPTLFDPRHYVGCEAGPPARSFVITFAGTIVKRNGLHRLVEMLPLVRERMPQLRVRIIGGGDYLDELVELIAQLQVQDIVELTPTLPADQIPREVMRSHVVCWLPVRSPFIDIVMSNKVLEALSTGVPVITPRTPCLEHYFKHDEISFIDSCQPKEVADAVLDLYHHYDTRKPSPLQTDRFRKLFAWAKERTKYEHVMTRMTGQEKGA
jgi:glycosyltransferase involved in cell wall biosynthesis